MIIFPFCFLILFLAAFSEQRIESLALRWQESVVLSFMFQVHKFFAINMVIPFFLCPVNIIPFSRLPLNHFPNSITSPFLVLVQAQFFTFSHCIRNRFFSFPALPKNRCSTLFYCAASHSFVLTAWSPAAINTPPPPIFIFFDLPLLNHSHESKLLLPVASSSYWASRTLSL